MKLIIDGYNVLKSMVGSALVTERERDAFIRLLSRYARQKQIKIHLVFDGGPSYFTDIEQRNDIELVFSGTQESADEYIQRYIVGLRTDDILLVSSDRELVDYCGLYGVDALDAASFLKFVQREITLIQADRPRQGCIKKLHPERTNVELDALMQDAARIIVHKKDDLVVWSPEQTGKRVKKRERSRTRKLKKL